MQRICQTCETTFEPTFHMQKNCAPCKQKKTVYKQNEREAQAEQKGKFRNVEDYVMPPEQTERLATYAAETLARVKSELPDKKLTMDDAMVIEGIAETMLGLENSWTKKVTLGKDPAVQLLVGGHFVDAIGSAAVERVHQNPALLQSATFAVMYRSFLPMVISWARKNKDFASVELIQDVFAELTGAYVLKTPRPGGNAPYPAETSADKPGVELPPPGRIRFPRWNKNDIPRDAQKYLDEGKI
jgi:hypothetical protein